MLLGDWWLVELGEVVGGTIEASTTGTESVSPTSTRKLGQVVRSMCAKGYASAPWALSELAALRTESHHLLLSGVAPGLILSRSMSL